MNTVFRFCNKSPSTPKPTPKSKTTQTSTPTWPSSFWANNGFLRMSKDITQLLNDWMYEPDEVMVRVVAGDDGRSKIQLRSGPGSFADGDGRPARRRPARGLRVLAGILRAHAASHDEADPDGPPLELKPEDYAGCGESVQYYHRYLSFWHLDLYELCARDTRRNSACSRLSGPMPATIGLNSSSTSGGHTCR